MTVQASSSEAAKSRRAWSSDVIAARHGIELRGRAADLEEPVLVHVVDRGVPAGLERAERLVDEVGQRRGLVEEHRRVVAGEEHRRRLHRVRGQVEQPEVAEAVRGDRVAGRQQLGDLDAVPLAGEVQVEQLLGAGGQREQPDQLGGQGRPERLVPLPQRGHRRRVHRRAEVQPDRVAVLVDQPAAVDGPLEALHRIHPVTVGDAGRAELHGHRRDNGVRTRSPLVICPDKCSR